LALHQMKHENGVAKPSLGGIKEQWRVAEARASADEQILEQRHPTRPPARQTTNFARCSG
jgi:hypothetical protein